MKIKLMIMSAALVGLVGLAGCSKDDAPDNSGTTGASCRVIKATGNIFGDAVSVDFTYDANKRFKAYTSDNGGDKEGELYTYNASGQIIKTEYWETSSTNISSYEEYTWSNGKVTEVKNYEDDGNGTLALYSTSVPVYTGSRITKMETFISGTKESYEEYVYDSKGNVTMITYYYEDGNGGFEADSRDNYTYDDKKAAEGYNRMVSDNPLIVSVNNELSNKSESYNNGSWTTDSNIAYTYTYNSDNYPASISLAGLGMLNFTYDCK